MTLFSTSIITDVGPPVHDFIATILFLFFFQSSPLMATVVVVSPLQNYQMSRYIFSQKFQVVHTYIYTTKT